MGDNPEEITLQHEHIHLYDFETEDTRTLEISHDEKCTKDYALIKRYLLLQSLIPADISQEIKDEVYAHIITIPEYFTICELIYRLYRRFFRHQFEKILEANEKVFKGSEIECAEFLLSLCEIMCSKPTFFSFILVGSFFTSLIFNFLIEHECYRILYIAEFCFDVLYKRVFCKLFTSKEDYRKLQFLGDELNDDDTLDSILSEWREIPFAVDWIGVVEKCVNITDERCSLTESEVEMFKKFYSVESCMKGEESAKSRETEETERDNFKASKYYHSECESCGSKCYNYLNNLNFIKENHDYFN